MASATRQARGRNPPAPAPAPAPVPSPALPSNHFSLSPAGTSVSEDDNATAANTPAPNPVVTLNVTDLQAVQQRIADLEAGQLNSSCRRRSDSESD